MAEKNTKKINHILIINGPNLNLLGKRETDIYGNETFESFFEKLKETYPAINFIYKQSNVEGELINFLHEAAENNQAVIINPGGYTHTSVAIADAIAAVDIPVVEVHISNIYAREAIRKVSLTGAKANGVITGFGLKGYVLAVESLVN